MDLEKEVESANKEVTDIVTLAQLPIVTQADYENAAGILKAAKGMIKVFDGIFDPLIKQANDHTKSIREEKKKHTDRLEQAEQTLRGKVTAYITEQQRIQREEQQKRDAEQKKLDDEAKAANEFLAEVGAAPVLAERVAPVAEVEKAGISFRKVWKYEIIQESLIPREYLAIDEVKIGLQVRALKDALTIPGVRIYSEDSAIVR
jgi:hypothetical protein